jgi:hypothetical protein
MSGIARPPDASPARMPWDGRFVFPFALLLALVVAGALLVFAVPHSPPGCDEALVTMPLPWGWTKWKELRDLGGFRVVSEPLQTPTGEQEASFLEEEGVCPGEGVRLDARRIAAFEPSPAVLWLRQSPFGDSYVVTMRPDLGADSPVPAPEQPLVAFVPEARSTFSISPADTRALLALDVAAAAAIALGIARARKKLRLARDLLDPNEFTEAVCREDGSVWMGTSAVSVRDGAFRGGRAGPVLVRVEHTSGGDYRTAPSVGVAQVVRGTRKLAADRETRGASMTLSAFIALTVSLTILGGGGSLSAWVTHVEASQTTLRMRAAKRSARLAETAPAFQAAPQQTKAWSMVPASGLP